MPTYEYACNACGHEFELFQNISDKPKRTCPKCGKRRAKRLISSGGGILFRGSGFHETDYRSDGYKKQALAESKDTSPKSDGDQKSSKHGDSGKSSKSSEKPAKKGDSGTTKSSPGNK